MATASRTRTKARRPTHFRKTPNELPPAIKDFRRAISAAADHQDIFAAAAASVEYMERTNRMYTEEEKALAAQAIASFHTGSDQEFLDVCETDDMFALFNVEAAKIAKTEEALRLGPPKTAAEMGHIPLTDQERELFHKAMMVANESGDMNVLDGVTDELYARGVVDMIDAEGRLTVLCREIKDIGRVITGKQEALLAKDTEGRNVVTRQIEAVKSNNALLKDIKEQDHFILALKAEIIASREDEEKDDVFFLSMKRFRHRLAEENLRKMERSLTFGTGLVSDLDKQAQKLRDEILSLENEIKILDKEFKSKQADLPKI
ncbi:MAG: hypothetical protein M1827_003591 [Pycnora praestabilis]|nr:MAG: hypothetical protein M1827_003591 [Pycnora praestabilis]